MKNQINQLIYHVIFLCLCFLGILDCFKLLKGENFDFDAIVYYTTLSNILCFIVIFLVTRKNYQNILQGIIYKKNIYFLKLKYYALIIIAITFIIYNFVLVENIFSPSWYEIGNLTKHILVPLLFIFDFFLFDERKHIKLKDVFISMSLPLIYVAIIIFRGVILPYNFKGTIFPYFFLNYKEIGTLNVAKWVLFLTVFYFSFAFIIYLLDKIKIKKEA